MASIFQTFFSFFCYLGLVIYYQVILAFLKGFSKMMTPAGKDRLNKKFSLLNICSLLIIPLSVPISLTGSISVKYPEHTRIFAKFNIIGIGCMTFIYGVLFMKALGYLLSELSSALKDDNGIIKDNADLQIVSKRLNRAYYIGGGLILAGSSNMIIFGSYDFLLRKVSYLLLFVRIIGIEIFFILIVTISKISPLRNTKIIPSAITVSSSSKKPMTLIFKPINPLLVLDPQGKNYIETA